MIIIEKIYIDNESSVICLIQTKHHGWCKDTTGPEIILPVLSHKNAPIQSFIKVETNPYNKKLFFENFAFFRFFSNYFLKMKLKNNFCLNLTTKTSKHHFDVSQLSDQCYTGFLLSLRLIKLKPIFFVFFFT
jgi:hypothetical protein